MSLRLLFVSTSVGVLGTGQGGGVELTIACLARELLRRGHDVLVAAPTGSRLDGVPIVEIPGRLQVPAQSQERDAPISLPPDPVLGNLWDYARSRQDKWDAIVNFAFDWLPFYLTPFFRRPIAHFISMGSTGDALDGAMARVAERYPGTVGVYTRTQAATFTFGDRCRILGSGIDLAQYCFNDRPEAAIAWLGRIAPEKALEDAIAAARQANVPLRVFGKLQDEAYWQRIQRDFPDAPFEYGGFLPTDRLQAEVGRCRALLMTPRWVEAFGNVAIEALACGVPVIAYQRGGPAEIVCDGKTGFLVEPDSPPGLVDAIARIDTIDRSACRRQAEAEYSLPAFCDRWETWLHAVVACQQSAL
ncbi:glycosyltransferase family 4 protein [Rubidibacter lacunae]|uniref:glycosyltransferase family 4 protein n=1 Tax=Rubidibacter lacunae TaxID=582514 RepID=UPI0038CDB19B